MAGRVDRPSDATRSPIVYGLLDPRNGTLRYIGKSVNGLKRAYAHGKPSALKSDQTHKGNWIRSLLKQGLVPEVVLLEEPASVDDLADLERFWIASVRATGAHIFNHCDGGEGATGRIVSTETRERLRLASIGNKSALGIHRSDETKEKIRCAHLGTTLSPKTRQKISAKLSGRKLTTEHVQNMSRGLMGHRGTVMTPELRQRMSASASLRLDRLKPVTILLTNQTAPSIKEAARILRTSPSLLANRLRGCRPWKDNVVLAVLAPRSQTCR